MGVTSQKLSLNQLTTSSVTQYTVPGATTTRLTELLICNTDTVERTITVSLVPSTGSASAANRVISALPVPTGATVVFQLNAVMLTGDFISAVASAPTAVNLYCSGAEIS